MCRQKCEIQVGQVIFNILLLFLEQSYTCDRFNELKLIVTLEKALYQRKHYRLRVILPSSHEQIISVLLHFLVRKKEGGTERKKSFSECLRPRSATISRHIWGREFLHHLAMRKYLSDLKINGFSYL